MNRHKLWKYAVLPGLISLVVAGGVIAWALSITDDFGGWISGIWPFDWGAETVGTIMEWLSGVLMVIIGLFTFRYIVMIVASPFMSILSEKVESIKTGDEPPSVSVGEMISDVIRGVRIALRNILWEIFLTLLLTIAGFLVPVIGNIITTALIFLVQAYYAGFGNMDYILERKRFSVKESVAFVGAHRGIAIGNGAGWLVIMLVPVLGWFMAPVLGTVAATNETMKVVKKA